MANHHRIRALLLLSAVLMGVRVQAQSEVPTETLLFNFPTLEAAGKMNRDVLRSECVWQYVSRSYPYSMEQAEAEATVAAARKQLQNRRKKNAANRSVSYSELRLQWDGKRTRSEHFYPEHARPFVNDYDSEKAVTIHITPDNSPYDTGRVVNVEEPTYINYDSPAGMATLFKGTPLKTVLKDAQYGQVLNYGTSALVDIQRLTRKTTANETASQARTLTLGDVRLIIATDTGRIERIDVFQAGGHDVILSRIIPSEYRTYHKTIQLPQRIVVYNYAAGRVAGIGEYTLLSAKFNPELAPDFLAASPLLSRPTLITDYRQSAEGMRYMAEGNVLTGEDLRHRRFRDQTRQWAPYALLVQIPLITGILLWRRIKALRPGS